MEKPFEFTARNKQTGEYEEYNSGLAPYDLRMNPDKWDLWIDTRYKAKLRLYNYINGIKPYKPFDGTEIGKTIPILNFLGM